MNRVTLFLLGSLMLLLNCFAAHGQGCRTVLQPQFSIYTSIIRDGKNVYTSVTIQGYANIAPGPGCQMNTATHHVGAENKLNNVDHWTYSGSGCPTCYFTATDNESIVGVPGIIYPWNWDGVAICSIVGTFFGSGGGGSIPGCVVPSEETTNDHGFNGGSYEEQFYMDLSDSAGDSFDSTPQVPNIDEQTAVTPAGTNTCWYNGSTVPKTPGVSGGPWSVGTVNGVPQQHNQYGYDSIGLDLNDVANIQKYGPGGGVKFPCALTIYQVMQIMCNANTWWPYRTNILTITIDINPKSAEICRDDECGVPVYQ